MDPVVDLIVRAALAMLFAVAALHKARDLTRFRATVAEYRVLPGTMVSPATAVLVAVEAGIALALVVPAARGVDLVAAAALLIVYASAIGVNLVRGRRDLDCGCAGPAVRRPISGWLVGRNVAFAVAALATAGPLAARPLGWTDGLTVVAATAALVALHVAFDGLVAQLPTIARLRSAA